MLGGLWAGSPPVPAPSAHYGENNMKLKDLKTLGAFVEAAPVEKEVTWTNPEGEENTFTVLVKRQSFGAMERVLQVDPKDPDRSRSASMIADSIILDEDEHMSYADAYNLHPSLALALVKVINEVNGSKAEAGPKA